MKPLNPFALPIDTSRPQPLLKAWMLLSLFSLIAAGLFSLLLVLSRTPGVQSFIPWVDFFHTALVVHVDLSVLIWFLSMSALLWSVQIREAPKFIMLAPALVAGGTLIMVVSPFAGAGDPLMNNYVPVLQHPLFFFGINTVAAGVALQLFYNLLTSSKPGRKGLLPSILQASVITTFIALLTLGWNWKNIAPTLSGTAYYEVLFWGPGHILQFSHTLLMLFVWVVLIYALGSQLPTKARTTASLLLVVVLPVLATPWIYFSFEMESIGARLAFTDLMKFGGLLSLPIGLICTWKILTLGKVDEGLRPIRAALFCSLVLFATGGIIGFLIEGVNVVIPAHYHGSIVGVTLAFMGLIYLILPKLGYGAVDSKLGKIQPFVYGGGQMMHILGLAWSGGYGVQRKTAGEAQILERLPEVLGMGMMGLGGLISIIGGVLFLIVALKSIFGKPSTIETNM
ncbi:MAG: cbb3-type cytochrome c oxidase subunit I [Pseudomonadales bacterium]|nr:cbb3-type cytochrome c oxidase subunit I [Pseudomonadales bacterium]